MAVGSPLCKILQPFIYALPSNVGVGLCNQKIEICPLRKGRQHFLYLPFSGTGFQRNGVERRHHIRFRKKRERQIGFQLLRQEEISVERVFHAQPSNGKHPGGTLP